MVLEAKVRIDWLLIYCLSVEIYIIHVQNIWHASAFFAVFFVNSVQIIGKVLLVDDFLKDSLFYNIVIAISMAALSANKVV